MNKAVSINLAGFLFNLEEGAYDKLSRYLKQIKSYFKTSEGADEIIQDIENRIAELFQERLKSKQVVLEIDVDEIIAIMGAPETYSDGGEPEETASQEQKFNSDSNTYEHRRLYRDPEEGMLGGVCTGVGYYFGIDPVWLRLAFVIALFLFGSGPLLYLILWIILPRAQTTAEKLRMRGEAVNIENIERRFKEELDRFKKKAEDFGAEAEIKFKRENVGNRASNFIEELFTSIMRAGSKLVRLLGRSLGLFLFVLGIAVLITFLNTIWGSGTSIYFNEGNSINVTPDSILPVFLNEGWQMQLAQIGLILVILCPIIGLLISGTRLLFYPKLTLPYVGSVNGFLFVTGLVCLVASSIMVMRSFRSQATIVETIELPQTKGDTLNVQVQPGEEVHLNSQMHFGRLSMYFIDGEQFVQGKARLRAIPSEEEFASYKVIRSAKGEDKKGAASSAKATKYYVNSKADGIQLNAFYQLENGHKWRDQRLDYEISIPIGTFVTWKGLQNIDAEIPCELNDENCDFERGVWKMTSNGLEPIYSKEI